MSKMILILIMGAFISYGIINITSNDNLTQSTENAADNYSLTKARNIANSTAEMIFANLGDNISWRVTSPVTVNILGGEATYTVKNAFFNGDSLIKISIQGNYFNQLKPVTIYTARNFKSPAKFPPIKGAVTSNNVTSSGGNMIIDGQDHTMASGTLIPYKGTLGVWTTKTFNLGGGSSVGGTYYTSGIGTDVPPTKTPAHLLVVAKNQTYQGGFPKTPEEALGGVANGYPDDILKKIAKLGLNGQYVTDPTTLKYPLIGITYVEMPVTSPSNIWQPSDLTGTGLLIIHNSATNAVIKNIGKGTFRGLIVADDIVHINSTLIGAVFSLIPTPSEGNIIGTGNGALLFSREAVLAAMEVATTHNFGFRAKRIDVRYWFE